MDKSSEKTIISVPLPTYNRSIREIRLNFAKDIRHYSWDILVYIKMHPELLKIGDNQKICDFIRDLQIQYRKKRTPGWSDEEAADFVDFMSDLEAQRYKGTPKEFLVYRCCQDEMDLFHPDLKRDELNTCLLMIMTRMHCSDKNEFNNRYDEGAEKSENESDRIVPQTK